MRDQPPLRLKLLLKNYEICQDRLGTDVRRTRIEKRELSVFAGPLRTVEELLLRHRAATVFQSLWRGRMGRRAVDTAMSFALFRRFADRCERTAVFSPLSLCLFFQFFWCLSRACRTSVPSNSALSFRSVFNLKGDTVCLFSAARS